MNCAKALLASKDEETNCQLFNVPAGYGKSLFIAFCALVLADYGKKCVILVSNAMLQE